MFKTVCITLGAITSKFLYSCSNVIVTVPFLPGCAPPLFEFVSPDRFVVSRNRPVRDLAAGPEIGVVGLKFSVNLFEGL